MQVPVARRHYFERLVELLPGSIWIRSLMAGVISLLLFFLLSLPSLDEILATKLFLLQLNFSFTIFLGFLLGQKAFYEYSRILKGLEAALKLSPRQGRKLSRDARNLLVSPVAHLFALPFAAAAIYVLMQSELEVTLVGTIGLPVFIYAVYFQCCFFMMDLLGATGYWLIFNLYFSLNNRLVSPNKLHLINIEQLRTIGALIRKLSIMLFFIILSLLPAIVFMANTLQGDIRQFLIYTGVFLPILFLLASFLPPSLALNRLVQASRQAKLERLQKAISALEHEFFSTSDSRFHSLESTQKLTKIASLRAEASYLQSHTRFVFSPSAFMEIGAAAIASPLTTAFLQSLLGGSS
ncbi:MAG: hypothetical protein KIT70_04740 [Anaerolineales bacterium]|nr:MAG: hypothetical protein KIT70_04740 [Anaerolineales bacterium]